MNTNNNNYHRIPRTDEEKRELYMKLSKEELVEMLINVNKPTNLKYRGKTYTFPSKRYIPIEERTNAPFTTNTK